MAARTVLVSTNHELIAQIANSCEVTDGAGGSLLFVETASPGDVKHFVEASIEPIGAVIADLSSEGEGIAILETLRATHPTLVLAAAHPTPSADLILKAMRAGASEFLTPPFDLAHLARGVQQPKRASERFARKDKGRIIAVMPSQSGNGATTVALHAACAAAAELKEKVLLIELDFHCGMLRERLNLNPGGSIADVLERTEELDDESWEEIIEHWNGVDLLTSPSSSRSLAGKNLQDLPALIEALAWRYPAVILDMPGTLMSSTKAILELTDELFLICTPDVSSLHLARRRAQELVDVGTIRDSLRIIMNRSTAKQRLHSADLAQVIGLPIDRTLDNDYIGLADAWEKAKILTPDTRLGKQLHDLGVGMVAKKGEAAPEQQRQPWKGLLSVFQH